MNLRQANVTINVQNIDKSISFYQALGMTMQTRWGNHYAQLTAPGIEIGLHPSTHLHGNSGNVSIGFVTDDIAETKSFLQGMAITPTERVEEGGEFLQFTDPDGTALYFIKPKWG